MHNNGYAVQPDRKPDSVGRLSDLRPGTGYRFKVVNSASSHAPVFRMSVMVCNILLYYVVLGS